VIIKLKTTVLEITPELVEAFIAGARNAHFTGNERGNDFPLPNWRIRAGLKFALERATIEVES
jgi:hypothetical protein